MVETKRKSPSTVPTRFVLSDTEEWKCPFPSPSAPWSLIDWKWPSVAPGVVQLVFSLSVQFCNSSMTSFTLSQHCAPSDSS